MDERIRFPEKGLVQDTGTKSFVLLQMALGGLQIDTFDLRQDTDDMAKVATRVAHAVLDYCISLGHFDSTLVALEL